MPNLVVNPGFEESGAHLLRVDHRCGEVQREQ